MGSSTNRLFRVSEIEIHYRNQVHPRERLQLNSSQQAYDAFLSIWDLNKIELIEQFGIMLLDRQCRCIGGSIISTGGTSACIVEPKLIFGTALKAQASGIIVAHNHPSGCLKPSDQDIQITDNLKDGAKLLGMYLTDHLIISRYDYHSFADNGQTSKSVKWSTLTS
jgi:DNA repair protein RadC